MRHPTKTTQIELNGVLRDFTAFDTGLCPTVCMEIFNGHAYPFLSDDVLPPERVQTIVDVGANIGASCLWWLSKYPQATIHAYEPCADNYAVLCENLPEANVHKYPVGLGGREEIRTLTHGPKDDAEATVYRVANASGSSEQIQVVSAHFVIESLLPISILKLDTEGCETEILANLWAWMNEIPVIYLEYHSEHARRQIDGLTARTHSLWHSYSDRVHRGTLCYVRTNVIPESYQSWEIQA